MHRQHVRGLDDVVAVEQLAGRRVAGDVHEGVALVHHVGAELGEPVDDAVDRVLVARDERRSKQHRVAGLELHLRVAAVRDARQGGHRLALRTGGHQHHLLRRCGVDLVDDDAVRNTQVAELAGDLHVAHHGASDVGDLATVALGGVEHLLDAVHVRRERRHDDALLAAGEHRVDGRRDVALGGGEPGHLGVGGVGQEEVDTGLAEARERPKVGDPSVERQLVHLEVAGVEHDAGGRLDGHREGVRDRVVHGHELAGERSEVQRLALGDDVTWHLLEPVLLQLGVDQRQGEPRPDDRDVRRARAGGRARRRCGPRGRASARCRRCRPAGHGSGRSPEGSGRRRDGAPRGTARRSRRRAACRRTRRRSCCDRSRRARRAG